MIWALWVIRLLSFPARVTALLASLEGVYASEKYSLSYLPLQDWQKSIADNATALSMGSIMELGTNLSCYVPHISTKDGDEMEELHESELEEMLSSNLKDGIRLIVGSFTGCITYLSGFWNYELCRDTGLTQFHGNSKTPSLYYVLGRSKASSTDREFQLLYNDFGYYISEIIGSGDICDVTGRPRVVEIQYVCRPAAGPASIQSVREVKTCHYELQVAIPSLCNLELLSKSEDREVSGSIVCAKSQQDSEISEVTELISYYKPTFIGSGLYFLEPCHKGTLYNRTALMYTGTLNFSENQAEEEYQVNEKFGNAIRRLLLQRLLLPPDQLPYEMGDKFAWMSEVLDSKGKFLSMVGFNLSSSLAEIIIDDSLRFSSPGNFLYYQRTSVEDKKPGGPPSEDKNPVGTENELAALDEDNTLDAITVEEVREILDNLLGPDEVAGIIHELNND